MRILGVDPGTATTGYALVETNPDRALTYGVILTPAGLPLEQRLREIHQRLSALIA